MSLKASRKLMSPINPLRSQEIIKQHKPNELVLPFYTKSGGGLCLDSSTYTRQSIPENAVMPSEYGGDIVLCKQC